MPDVRILLFGGNGFVGSAIAPKLVARGITPVIVSRSGTPPTHLKDVAWTKQAIWYSGDAAFPDGRWYKNTIATLCLVGSPPLPTFSQKAFEKQLYTNSQPNIGAIGGAREAGCKKVVLLGAHIPALLNKNWFAYAKGKRLCLEAAKDFASGGMKRSAAVLQPSAIYGTRYDKAGKAINLEKFMAPIARHQANLPVLLRKITPEQLVSVEAVADRLIHACLDDSFTGRCLMISNEDLSQEASIHHQEK